MIRLARAIQAQGRFDEALQLYEQILATTPTGVDDGTFDIAWYRSHYGLCLAEMGRFADAEAQLLESHRVLVAQEDFPAEKVIERIAILYDMWGKPDRAAEWRAKLPDTDPDSPSP